MSCGSYGVACNDGHRYVRVRTPKGTWRWQCRNCPAFLTAAPPERGGRHGK